MCAPPGAPMIAPSTAINAPIAPLSMVAPMTPNTIAVMAPPNVAAAGCFLIAASGSTVLSEVSTFILHPLSLRINPNHVRASGKLSDSDGVAAASRLRRAGGRRAGDPLENQFLRFVDVAPAEQLDPLPVFEVLVVGEEVLDLLDRDLRELRVVLHRFVAAGQARHG